MPSALAVVRFMIKSNLVGCSTGMSLLAERGSNEPWAYGVAANAPWTPFKSELTRKHRYPGPALLAL
jgi:hypothetical protein